MTKVQKNEFYKVIREALVRDYGIDTAGTDETQVNALIAQYLTDNPMNGGDTTIVEAGSYVINPTNYVDGLVEAQVNALIDAKIESVRPIYNLEQKTYIPIAHDRALVSGDYDSRRDSLDVTLDPNAKGQYWYERILSTAFAPEGDLVFYLKGYYRSNDTINGFSIQINKISTGEIVEKIEYSTAQGCNAILGLSNSNTFPQDIVCGASGSRFQINFGYTSTSNSIVMKRYVGFFNLNTDTGKYEPDILSKIYIGNLNSDTLKGRLQTNKTNDILISSYNSYAYKIRGSGSTLTISRLGDNGVWGKTYTLTYDDTMKAVNGFDTDYTRGVLSSCGRYYYAISANSSEYFLGKMVKIPIVNGMFDEANATAITLVAEPSLAKRYMFTFGYSYMSSDNGIMYIGDNGTYVHEYVLNADETEFVFRKKYNTNRKPMAMSLDNTKQYIALATGYYELSAVPIVTQLDSSSTDPFNDGSLLAKYEFQNNLSDTLGGSDLISVGVPIPYGVGIYGQGLEFDTNMDKKLSTLNPVPTGSISFYFKSNAVSGKHFLYDIHNGGNSALYEHGGSHLLSFKGSFSNLYVNGVPRNSGEYYVTPNEWTHIVIEYNGNKVIGIGDFTAENNDSINGVIDQVEIYNRALTLEEVQRLGNQTYTAPVQLDSSSTDPFNDGSLLAKYELNGNLNDTLGNHNGIAKGAITYQEGTYGQEAVFTSDDDGFDIPDLGVNVHTISFTVTKLKSTHRSMPLYFNTNGFLYFANLIGVQNDGVYNYTTNGSGIASVTADYGDGIPTHIVLVVDDVNTKVYVDGVLKDTTNSTSPITGVIRIGYSYDDIYRFDGSIDQIEIYNRALTLEEVQRLGNQTYIDGLLHYSGGNAIFKITPPAGVTSIQLVTNQITQQIKTITYTHSVTPLVENVIQVDKDNLQYNYVTQLIIGADTYAVGSITSSDDGAWIWTEIPQGGNPELVLNSSFDAGLESWTASTGITASNGVVTVPASGVEDTLVQTLANPLRAGSSYILDMRIAGGYISSQNSDSESISFLDINGNIVNSYTISDVNNTGGIHVLLSDIITSDIHSIKVKVGINSPEVLIQSISIKAN